MEENLKKILESLSNKEKELLPPSYDANFLDALALLLRMKGWAARDIVEMMDKINKDRYKIFR